MDWQLRIALIIAGCALVGYVYYDYAKKKRIQKENEKLKQQFSNVSDNVDSSGFDHVGVGTPRPASYADDVKSDLDSQSLTENKLLKGSTVEEFIDQSMVDESKTLQQAEPTSHKGAKVAIDSQSSNQKLENETTLSNLESEPKPELKPEPDKQPDKAMVLSLILQAPQGTHFKGRDFLPLFLSQGLRHGEMGIFHRRARSGKEPGPVLFSLANGIAPGTFDINNMDNFETPALACFVTLPGPDDAQVAYNAMYKTCLLLQQELGGDLLDESKSVYSKQTHNHRLDQIKDYSFKFGA